LVNLWKLPPHVVARQNAESNLVCAGNTVAIQNQSDCFIARDLTTCRVRRIVYL